MEIDWKKKYEEALEKARELHGTVAVGKNFFVEIFPELRESKDEKIRSALLRGFNSMLANQPIGTFYGEPIKDIIAYLEKQKGQKPLPGFDDLTPDEKMNHPLYLEGFDAGREVGRIEAEQRPGWSEEEEQWLDNAIYFLESAKRHYIDDPYEIEETIVWLKSLKNRGNFLKRNSNSPSWKPSAAQMVALLSELPVVKGSGNKVQNILESLYDDLTKLL